MIFRKNLLYFTWYWIFLVAYKGMCEANVVAADGGWSTWTTWGECSVTCGNGIATRTRFCDNPESQCGGWNCTGDDVESKQCKDMCCPNPIKGEWGTWTSWSECSVTCGSGLKTRTRNCDDPLPQYGGRYCCGRMLEKQLCGEQACRDEWDMLLLNDDSDTHQQFIVRVDGEWFRVCGDSWSTYNTMSVCRYFSSTKEPSSSDNLPQVNNNSLLYIDCPSISAFLSDCTRRLVETDCCPSGVLKLSCLNKETIDVSSNRTFSRTYCNDGYPKNSYQEIFFIASTGNKLKLHIRFIDTAIGNDFITIGNGNVTDERRLISYSGGPAVNVLQLTSEENMVWMTFVTGARASYRGFQFEIGVKDVGVPQLSKYVYLNSSAWPGEWYQTNEMTTNTPDLQTTYALYDSSVGNDGRVLLTSIHFEMIDRVVTVRVSPDEDSDIIEGTGLWRVGMFGSQNPNGTGRRRNEVRNILSNDSSKTLTPGRHMVLSGITNIDLRGIGAGQLYPYICWEFAKGDYPRPDFDLPMYGSSILSCSDITGTPDNICPDGYGDFCGNEVCVLKKTHNRAGFCHNPGQEFFFKSSVVAYVCDDGLVTLSNEPKGYNSGSLQVKMGTEWLMVCGNSWGHNETKVACNELGYSGGNHSFSKHSGGRYIKSISRQEEAATIKECQEYVTAEHNCINNAVVSLTCGEEDEGDVRLLYGGDPHAGLIQVIFKGTWRYLSGTKMSLGVANVTCRKLGYGKAVFVTHNIFLHNDTQLVNPDLLNGTFNCKGVEYGLVDCSYSQADSPCVEPDYAGVICEESSLSNLTESKIRLSKSGLKGYVIVNFNGQQYSICNRGWDQAAGRVVCRQLGVGSVVDVSGTYEEGTGDRIILSGIRCEGDESNIFDCNYETIGDAGNMCNRSNDAWVECLSENGQAFDPMIGFAFAVFVLIITMVCGMMWYGQVLAVRRIQRRPLPPIPVTSALQDSDSDIYNEVLDEEDPYYIKPIASEETLEKLETTKEEAAEVTVHVSDGTNKNEEQRNELSPIMVSKVLRQEHGTDSCGELIKRKQEESIATSDGNKKDKKQMRSDDTPEVKRVEKAVEFYVGEDEKDDEEGAMKATDDNEQFPLDEEVSVECSKTVDEGNGNIEIVAFGVHEKTGLAEAETPVPPAGNCDETNAILYASSIFHRENNSPDA